MTIGLEQRLAQRSPYALVKRWTGVVGKVEDAPQLELRARLNRQRGCLMGLAVADALGAAVEFKSPGSFEPVVGYRSDGPHGLDGGEWTDDTSMALALADSIANAGWDLNDQARRYLSWWREGTYSVNGRCFDIGNTTAAALRRFQESQDASTSGDCSSRSSGNGSIMRLAPVPLRYLELFPDRPQQLVRFAAESSLPTHASPQCVSACRYMALVLAGLMHGLDRGEVLAANWEPLEQLRRIEPLHPEVEAVAAGSYRELEPPMIKGNGYVVKSLEASLWAFHDAHDFREAVLRAVNLGDDADTTGAVCGQFAGAFWGEAGIPPEWLEGLAKRQMIEQALEGLLSPAASASLDPPNRSSYWVVPGKLLAGAYPGSPFADSHQEKVEKLLGAGVQVFVNLMEEHETDHAGNAFNRYEDLVSSLASDATCERFAIKDLSIPTAAAMETILDAIDSHLQNGRTVYVHCWGGVGRTGTVVGCWMLRHGLATAEDVLEKLTSLRIQDKERGRRQSPETDAQREFVLAWPH